MTNKNGSFKWWAAEHNADPTVLSLSISAELLYRRLLDLIWQSPDCRFPNDRQKAFYAAGRGFEIDYFSVAWDELIYPGFEALSVTRDGKWLHSERLDRYREVIDKKAASGRLGGRGNKRPARRVTVVAPTDDTIKSPPVEPKKRGRPPRKGSQKEGPLMSNLSKILTPKVEFDGTKRR